jgi:O-methyltransferase
MHHTALLTNYPIISDQIQKPALAVVLRELEQVLEHNEPGDIVELGCYVGTTSLFLRRLLDASSDPVDHIFHVYDSFAGLPDKTAQDTSAAGVDFKAGELTVSKKEFLQTFQKAHLQPPHIHKGWFRELKPSDLPETIAFAFLDGDFYQSILDSLRLVWPKLSQHGVICIDDYQRQTLPGVERAVRDFFQGKTYRLRSSHNIAVITR